ncbi:MAG: transporter substrate-binding domain-containing protein [Erysipelotrichaceae bacterium]|nr:transporter substrate-binding domain-containing protein [Erysipelotrichaceae bacterium]
MKKIITLLFCVFMILGLASCRKNQGEPVTNDEPQSLLEKIRMEGKIVIATEGTWAPYTYVDESGNLTGYDVEVARAVADRLGVEAEFVTGDFDGFLIGLDNGVYDAVFNDIDVTEERAAKYDFSDPYINSTVVLIVPEDNTTITSFADLEGKTTTNTITSSYAATAEECGATVLGANTFEETINLVLQGRADATLNSLGSFNDYMSVHPDEKLKVVDSFVSYAAVPLRKGEPELLEAINKALADLKADGYLSKLSYEFFGEDVTGD